MTKYFDKFLGGGVDWVYVRNSLFCFFWKSIVEGGECFEVGELVIGDDVEDALKDVVVSCCVLIDVVVFFPYEPLELPFEVVKSFLW